MNLKPVIGLIGGIGSGKSRVAAELARHGGKVIAGDQLGHEALRQPDIREKVIRRWSAQVLDDIGEVDRQKLGAIVFADPAERRELEKLVHPWIKQGFREQIAAARADPRVALIVIDAAILLEAGWHEICNYLVYVHALRPLRLERLARQRGWSAKEVEAREQAQWSLTEKASRADFAVDNSGTPEATARQVADLLRRLGIGPAAEEVGLS
jgi:dephospho-CoA kinase